MHLLHLQVILFKVTYSAVKVCIHPYVCSLGIQPMTWCYRQKRLYRLSLRCKELARHFYRYSSVVCVAIKYN